MSYAGSSAASSIFPATVSTRANPPLGEIQSSCLILLYRVLFILYAESRDLLPLDNRDYAMQYSLDHLATDIHEKLDGSIAFAPGASLYWTRLRQLFTLINDGWEDHIPQYNGGLFNPQQHSFLERLWDWRRCTSTGYRTPDTDKAGRTHRLP